MYAVKLLQQNLVTKEDLWQLRADIKEGMKEQRAEFRNEMKEHRAEFRSEMKLLREDFKRLQENFNELRADVDSKLGNAKVNLIMWFAGIYIVTTITLCTLIFATLNMAGIAMPS